MILTFDIKISVITKNTDENAGKESNLPEKNKQRRLLKTELRKHYFHKQSIWYLF